MLDTITAVRSIMSIGHFMGTGKPFVLGFNKSINLILNRIAIRAESNNPKYLARAFVPVEEIAIGLSRIDHQVIYGRRGTGKTHALSNLASEVESSGDLAVYIDLRKIGSNNGLYADFARPRSLRATRLLIDIVEAVHTRLLAKSIDDERFESMLPLLDAVAEAATQIRVEGPVDLTSEEEQEGSRESSGGWHIDIESAPSVRAGADHSKKFSGKQRSRSETRRSGEELPRLMFGPLGRTLETISQSIAPHRIWILLDEWSSIPIDLQPFVADMLRRIVFPAQGWTVKIASIERRSRFIVRGDNATYIGLELGADTAAALSLDEHLLAKEDGSKAQQFFSELLSRHVFLLAEDLGTKVPKHWDNSYFVRTAFDTLAFRELVRAAEGVPRDAINIAGQAAIAAGAAKIQVSDIRNAARKYYLQDKETGVAGNQGASSMWHRLQAEVVVARGVRTFLLRRNRDHTHPAILDLYDARLIHLLRPGLASAANPGIGYDGYCVDYGSYIHLLDEKRAESMWGEHSHPWEYDNSQILLPDRFDEEFVFLPGNARERYRIRKRSKKISK